MINIDDFGKMDLRVGTILSAELLETAKNPTYVLKIDFGKLGIKQSSSQITDIYQPSDLVGRQIIAIVNLPSKNIAGSVSEVLVLGANDKTQAVVLLEPQEKISNGVKVS